MKKNSRILVSILVLMLVFSSSLVGCASKSSETTKEEANNNATKVKEEEPKAEGSKALDWPKKAIQLIVPYNPGGDTDFNARVYAKYMSEIFGESIVVTNVTGSGGTIGSRHAKDSDPDGYNILFYHTSMHVNEATEVVDYGLDAFDFGCVAGKNAGNVICVSKDSPYNTLKELIDASIESPGEITFAGNAGATTYVMGSMLNKDGAKFNIVDMGGSAARVAALKGGHVDVIPNSYGTARSFLENGDFKALAIMEDERNEVCPDIPTAIEQGYESSSLPIYYFFAFPKGTPTEIIEKWNAAAKEVSQMDGYAKEIEKAYLQKPYFIEQEDGYNLLSEQRENILGLKDYLLNK